MKLNSQNSHFITLLPLSALLVVACHSTPTSTPTSMPQSPRVFDPASSLEERVAASETNRPKPYAELIKRNTSQSTQDSSPTSNNRLAINYRDEVIADGLKALDEGDIARALERSYTLWHALDVERSRSQEINLSLATFRNPALLLALAQAESSHGKDTTLAEKIVHSNPKWEPGYIVLGHIYLKRHSLEIAEKVTRTAFDRIESPTPSLIALRTKALQALGRNGEAMRVVNLGLEKYPNNVRLIQWQGLLEFSHGDLDKSCALFAKAFENSQADAVLTHNHAICLTQSGRLEEALGVLRSVLLENPQSASLRLLTGIVLKKLGNYAEARLVWREYLDLSEADDPQREVVTAALNDLTIREESALSQTKPLAPQ